MKSARAVRLSRIILLGSETCLRYISRKGGEIFLTSEVQSVGVFEIARGHSHMRLLSIPLRLVSRHQVDRQARHLGRVREQGQRSPLDQKRRFRPKCRHDLDREERCNCFKENKKKIKKKRKAGEFLLSRAICRSYPSVFSSALGPR